MTERIQLDQRVISQGEVALSDGSALVIPNDGVPTQVANPSRASLRTAVAAIVGLVLVLNPVLAIVIEVLRSLEPTFAIPPLVYVILNGIILVVTAIITLVTRVLAIPGVNEWIKNYLPWLAAIPVVKADAAG